MIDTRNGEIPDRFVDFCKEVGRLAREMDVTNCDVKITPAWNDEWRGEVTCHWTRGRHGADRDKLTVTTSRRIYVDLGDETS
jgi:hypothetical protein